MKKNHKDVEKRCDRLLKENQKLRSNKRKHCHDIKRLETERDIDKKIGK